MIRITVISKSDNTVVRVANSINHAAELLGVTRQAISKARRKHGTTFRVGKFILTELERDVWCSGYALTEAEIRLLGIQVVTKAPEPEPKVCACCGREYIVGLWHSQKSQYCKVCIGTHRLILGRLVPTHTTNPVTDGVNTYASLKEAAESTGRPLATAKPAIYKVLVGEKRTYLGLAWRPLPKEPQCL